MMQNQMGFFMPAVTDTPMKNQNGEDEDWCIHHEKKLAKYNVESPPS